MWWVPALVYLFVGNHLVTIAFSEEWGLVSHCGLAWFEQLIWKLAPETYCKQHSDIHCYDRSCRHRELLVQLVTSPTFLQKSRKFEVLTLVGTLISQLKINGVPALGRTLFPLRTLHGDWASDLLEKTKKTISKNYMLRIEHEFRSWAGHIIPDSFPVHTQLVRF